jgi:hypothetical protein
MQSQIRTFSYPNGEIQRVQTVSWEDWGKLSFLQPQPTDRALDVFYDIYRLYLVPGCPWIFGNLVLFRIPEGVAVPFETETKYGSLSDPLTVATAALEAGVTIERGKPRFRNPRVKEFWQALEEKNCIRITSGYLPTTKFIPVAEKSGYLSQASGTVKVNASFFIMDRFDCATVYDQVGTPLGLCVKDGFVSNPPLFSREALLVRKSGVAIEQPKVEDLTLEIAGEAYRHGENATIYSRPHRNRTPRLPGKKLIIIGTRVAAVSHRPSVPIPASGFVLAVDGNCPARPGDEVRYLGLEDVIFGIQVGNSILKDGIKTDRFISKFYNIRKAEPVPFPPSLYPMDFDHARAGRIALGADKNGNPMLLWAEGAGKRRYVKGEDSCGASLREMAQLCAAVGMVNAVNLDGGGSAQILVNNRRHLHISDRNDDNSDAERPVPLGLAVQL